ncbi:MAG: hypothetical protein R2932_41085 [Caldilineaceae bacterium]
MRSPWLAGLGMSLWVQATTCREEVADGAVFEQFLHLDIFHRFDD